MNNVPEFIKLYLIYFRYGVTQGCLLLLALLLILFRKPPSIMQTIIIPALVVYTLGATLISSIQILITVSANTKAKADGDTPRGIPEKSLAWIIFAHIMWFALFLAYIVYHTFIFVFV